MAVVATVSVQVAVKVAVAVGVRLGLELGVGVPVAVSVRVGVTVAVPFGHNFKKLPEQDKGFKNNFFPCRVVFKIGIVCS